MKTALIQMQMAPDAKTNLVKSLTYLEQAAGMGADLVLYPEIQLSQFFPQFPGNIGGCCGGGLRPKPLTMEDGILQMFCELCRKYHVMASPNFYFMENGKAYDTSFLIGRDGRVIGRQKMVHIVYHLFIYREHPAWRVSGRQRKDGRMAGIWTGSCRMYLQLSKNIKCSAREWQ